MAWAGPTSRAQSRGNGSLDMNGHCAGVSSHVYLSSSLSFMQKHKLFLECKYSCTQLFLPWLLQNFVSLYFSYSVIFINFRHESYDIIELSIIMMVKKTKHIQIERKINE